MATTTITVSGMTCEHCVNAVRQEITGISGVNDVKVDLESGRVVIDSNDPIDRDALGAAVDEAGYELVG